MRLGFLTLTKCVPLGHAARVQILLKRILVRIRARARARVRVRIRVRIRVRARHKACSVRPASLRLASPRCSPRCGSPLVLVLVLVLVRFLSLSSAAVCMHRRAAAR